MAPHEATEIVRLSGCSKAFAGRLVLRDVSLNLAPGEIRGLLGQNGSGKSTLIKILSAFHAPEPGAELHVRGEPVKLPMDALEPRRLGFRFVHQDLGLLDRATVLENVRFGLYEWRFGWRIPWRSERRAVRDALRRFAVDVDPDAMVSTLAPLDRAQVAIVRALEQMRGTHQGLLVLDEPTAHLPREEVERLFATIRSVAATGTGVLLVTHRLEEMRAVTDSLTILRDGEVTLE